MTQYTPDDVPESYGIGLPTGALNDIFGALELLGGSGDPSVGMGLVYADIQN